MARQLSFLTVESICEFIRCVILLHNMSIDESSCKKRKMKKRIMAMCLFEVVSNICSVI